MLAYRKEIDGLRGIAVLSVILFHADFERFFAGGYVGVDIFFVISGYLITKIIHEDIMKNKFTLTNFYERRCRRILPMLFFSIWITALISFIWIPPTTLEQIGRSIYAIVTFRGNFFFWRTDDYFNPVLKMNPLVHTWSLAVEEQFYLFYPLLFYIFRKRQCLLFQLLLVIGMMSFILAQWGDNIETIWTGQFHMFAQHRWASYFLPFGRVWELLIGCAASIFIRPRFNEKVLNWIQQMLAAIGIVLIFVSIYTLNSRYTYPFPNCYTLLPTVGTFLVLVFGDSRTVVGQILSLRALRWIGLISYSLYLWHQPLFTFIPLIHLQPLTNFSVLVLIIFLMALSIVTYHVIERPFRNTNHLRAKQVFQLTVLATMFSVILSVLIVHKTNKYMGSSTQNVDAQLHSKIEAMYGRSICYGIWDQSEECKSFSNSTLKKLLVVGDSYGDDTMHMIQQGGHLREYEMRGFYIPNKCQIYLGDRSRYDFIAIRFHQECRRSPDILDARLLISRADLIIFASYWFQWSLENLSSTIQLLNLTTNQRYLIVSGKHLHPCNKRSGVTQLQRYRHESKLMFLPSVVQGNRILRKTFSASKFIDLEKLLCNGPNETCHVFTPTGELIFRDCFHLSRCGAHYLGNIVFGQNHFNLNF